MPAATALPSTDFTPARLGMAVAALAVAALAAHMLWVEQDAARAARQLGDAGFALDEVPLPVPYALASQTVLLDLCLTRLLSPAARLFPEQSRARLARRCRAFSQVVLQSAPGNALALATHATAQAALGDNGAAQAALSLSRRAAGAPGWMAERRLQLVFSDPSLAQGQGKAGVIEDIATLLHDRQGRSFLARWYLTEPAARALIAAALGDAAPRFQQAFLRQVAQKGGFDQKETGG